MNTVPATAASVALDPLTQTLIDAAEACFVRHGVAKTTMSHVAEEAGVSRTTLYKRFAVMEEVLQAVFIREFDRFEARLAGNLEPIDDPGERLVEIVVAIAENVPENAGLARLLDGPRTRTENMALAAGRRALNDRVIDMIGDPLDGLARAGVLRGDVERGELIEWIRRVVNSLAVFPQPRSRSSAERRRFVARFLLPSITAAHDLPPMEVC
jgi:AcrR family transcriptional regulator